jgi:hypothetical protein
MPLGPLDLDTATVHAIVVWVATFTIIRVSEKSILGSFFYLLLCAIILFYTVMC